MSSSEHDSISHPARNGDYELDYNSKDVEDADDYELDSDLDLDKDVRPISEYIDNREELFRQVMETLEPEGRLEALIPEILSVLPRIELEQLCLEHLKTLPSKKLRYIMEGLDINNISSGDEEEALPEVVTKWKPLQEESAQNQRDNEESRSRSSSRSSRSSESSRSSDSGSRHRRRHHKSRHASRHRRHRHGRKRHRHGHRRHRHRSDSDASIASAKSPSNEDLEDASRIVKENSETESLHADANSKSSVASITTPSVPMIFDPITQMMIPVIAPVIASSIASSAAPFINGATGGFIDPTFVAAGTGIALPTLPTMAGVPIISSTGVAPAKSKKSQYDVDIEDEFGVEDDYEEEPVISKPSSKPTKSEPIRTAITSRVNVPVTEIIAKKADAKHDREVTPPPPGTGNGFHFENNNELEEPAPPGTAEIMF